MKDPKRLLDDLATLGEPEQRALRADAQMGAPEEAKSAVWGMLATDLPLPPQGPGGGEPGGGGSGPDAGPWDGGPLQGTAGNAAGGASAAGSAAAPVTVATVLKGLAAGIGVAVAVTALSHVAWDADQSSATESQTMPLAPASAAPARVTGAEGKKTEPEAQSGAGESEDGTEAARPAKSSRAKSSARRAASRLRDQREESRLIARARVLLQAGSHTEALGLLQRAKQRFPNGILVQEREALAIEAMAQSGQSEAARKRADSFLRTHPSSPHAARVKEATTD